MRRRTTIQIYNDRAEEFASLYESLRFEDIYSDVLDLMPAGPASVLDVGSGSGRDAAWFARNGCEVIAIDPAQKMLEEARKRHSEPSIRWIQDKLPGLESTFRLGLSFDLILVSAVLMHIHPDDRPRAFRKLVSLLKPRGTIIFTLRHGPMHDDRDAFETSTDEIERLARQHGIGVCRETRSADELRRPDVNWQTVCLQLPADGTGTLPLLRHIILNDDKSSTYKLALLRILVRIADSASGMVREVDDDHVALPFGLVALYWLRMYKPLIERGIPQKPAAKSPTGLGFVKEAFHNVVDISPYDLRIGARFGSGNAKWIRESLKDARNTIHKMPANYITFPNSLQRVFMTKLGGSIPSSPSVVLDREFLLSFGEMHIPREVWLCISRYASWIEPALVSEWIRLMRSYAPGYGRADSYDELMHALTWLDPERDTNFARSIASQMLSRRQSIYCVWSGKKLAKDLDIDHCFPFSAWPCGDLWNLLPSQRAINQHKKADKLVTARTLERARPRILEWWHAAYLTGGNSALASRFYNEANSTLPLMYSFGENASESVFDGLMIKRTALKQDLQLRDWSGTEE